MKIISKIPPNGSFVIAELVIPHKFVRTRQKNKKKFYILDEQYAKHLPENSTIVWGNNNRGVRSRTQWFFMKETLHIYFDKKEDVMLFKLKIPDAINLKILSEVENVS